MGIFICLGIILAVCIGLIIFGCCTDTDWLSVMGSLFAIVDVSILVVALLGAMTLETDFAYIESQYNNLKEQIEYCESDDIVTDDNLRNQVLDMNNTISKHRNYCHNYWIGVYYSERIGNLENLKWKSKK